MLDLVQLYPQIVSFSGSFCDHAMKREEAHRLAETRLRLGDETWQTAKERIAQSRTSWLNARWRDAPGSRYPAPPAGERYAALAADGSQIVSDRHDSALCCLINIGLISLRYGDSRRPLLCSQPHLELPGDELIDNSEAEYALLAGPRIALRRLLAELEALVELLEAESEEHPQDNIPPMFGLVDGSLILWPLEKEEPNYRKETLDTFTNLLERAQQAGTPVAGYISQPQSRDVVNSLRIVACPYPAVNCDSHCPNRAEISPECAYPARLTDADLFSTILQPGERSSVYQSTSKILGSLPKDQRICFYYLNAGDEIARVELPEWVASDPELLNRTHALCWDQACKGDGYPVALAEAHEQAVVHPEDRAAFFRIVERQLMNSGQGVRTTRKAAAKRLRRV